MEVTHSDDHVTTAVIGGADKIQMTIEADAMFMQMLSANLYNDPVYAIVRETITNADDAHKEGGVDLPVEIIVDRTMFQVKDFGPGIPREKMGEVYGTYGKSTKRGNGAATGGFGLGCKSPFAYTDSFQVVSCHNGTKTIYAITKSDSEIGGLPSIIPMVSVPTQETGLTVTINLTEQYHVHEFSRAAQKVVHQGGIFAHINGKEAERIDYSVMKHGFMIFPQGIGQSDYNDRVFVKYGAVLYPVHSREEYEDNYDLAKKLASLSGYERAVVVLEAKPGTLSLMPSREELSMQAETIQTIKGLLEGFVINGVESVEAKAREIHNEALDNMAKAKLYAPMLEVRGRDNVLKNYREHITKTKADSLKPITDLASLASYYVRNTYPFKHATYNVDLFNRLRLLSQEGSPFRGMAQSLAKSIKRDEDPQDWFIRNVVAPVQQIISEMTPVKGKDAAKYLTPSRLLNMDTYKTIHSAVNWGFEGHRSIKATEIMDHAALLPYVRKLIFVTHKAEGVFSRMSSADFDTSKQGPKFGALLYEVQRNKTAVNEAKEFIERLKKAGYWVVSLLDTVDYRAPPVRNKLKPEEKKPVGLVALRSVYSGGSFKQKLLSSNEDIIEKPIAITQLHSKSSYYNTARLPEIKTAELSLAVVEMFGDRIGVVRSSVQYDAWRAKGAISVRGLLIQELQAFYAKPENLASLGWSEDKAVKHLVRTGVNPGLVSLFNLNETLQNARKFKEAQQTQEQEDYAKLLRLTVANDPTSGDKLSNLMQLCGLVKVPRDYAKFIHKVDKSLTLQLVDVPTLQSLLLHGTPAEKEFVTKFLIKGLKG